MYILFKYGDLTVLDSEKKKVLFGLIFLKFMNGPNTLTAAAADCV